MQNLRAKESLSLVATAAAKLALQQFDPEAKKIRQEFKCGQPQAVISFHLKQLLHLNKDFLFTLVPNDKKVIFVYLRLTLQNISKITKLHRILKAARPQKARRFFEKRGSVIHGNSSAEEESSNEMILNQIKIFSVELPRKRADPENTILLELLLLDSLAPKTKELTLCHLEIHLHDFLKDMHGTKVIPLQRESKISVGFLEIDYVMRYGVFGYGYSHQFAMKDTPVSNIVKESLFVRVPPYNNRKDGDGFLTCSNLNKPSFIPYLEKKDDEPLSFDFGKSTRDSQKDGSTLNFKAKESHINLVEKLIKKRKRLQNLKEAYVKETTRNDRINFLKSLFSNPETEKAKDGSIIFNDGDDDPFHDDDRDGGGFSRMGNAFDENHAAGLVGKLNPLLTMASSVQKRERSDILRHRTTNLISGKIEESIDESVTSTYLEQKPRLFNSSKTNLSVLEETEDTTKPSVGTKSNTPLKKFVSGVNTLMKKKHGNEDSEKKKNVAISENQNISPKATTESSPGKSTFKSSFSKGGKEKK